MFSAPAHGLGYEQLLGASVRCVVWCVLGGAVVGCDGVLWCCGVVCGVWCVVCGVVWCGVEWCCLLRWWDNVVFGGLRPIGCFRRPPARRQASAETLGRRERVFVLCVCVSVRSRLAGKAPDNNGPRTTSGASGLDSKLSNTSKAIFWPAAKQISRKRSEPVCRHIC